MQPGDVLDQAAKLLATHGNCANEFKDQHTGEYCAWGAINQVTMGSPMPVSYSGDSDSEIEAHSPLWEALYNHLPEGFIEKLIEDHPEFADDVQWIDAWHRQRNVVVAYNNLHPGQPVIELFEKAAADLGHQ